MFSYSEACFSCSSCRSQLICCQVPKWAEGTNLRTALLKQCYMPPDLDQIFATVEMPDLSSMFVEQRKRWFGIFVLDVELWILVSGCCISQKKLFLQVFQENKQCMLGAAPREFQARSSEGLSRELNTLWFVWNMLSSIFMHTFSYRIIIDEEDFLINLNKPVGLESTSIRNHGFVYP